MELSKFYGKSSIQGIFLHALENVIYKNSKIFKRFWWYANMFESYKVILSQTILLNANWRLKNFPSTQDIDKVENDKRDFKKKLIEILNFLLPSYAIVEHLYNFLGEMNANTRIHPNRLRPLIVEANKVNEIFQDFEKKLKNCSLPIYGENVNYVRKTTNRLAGLEITREVASLRLSLGLDNLDQLRPEIDRTLNEARTIDFAKLYAATNRFYEDAMIALNAKGDSSSK